MLLGEDIVSKSSGRADVSSRARNGVVSASSTMSDTVARRCGQFECLKIQRQRMGRVSGATGSAHRFLRARLQFATRTRVWVRDTRSLDGQVDVAVEMNQTADEDVDRTIGTTRP
jgi:hypothetical protein